MLQRAENKFFRMNGGPLCLCVGVGVHMHTHTHSLDPNTDYRPKSSTNLLAGATLSSDWKPVNLWIWDTVVLCLRHCSAPNACSFICPSRVISGLLRSVRRKPTNILNSGWGINI